MPTYIALLILLLSATRAMAFTSTTDSTRIDSTSIDTTSPGIVTRIVDDFGAQATAIFRIDGGDALWLSGAAAITTALILNDGAIDNQVRDLKSDHEWIARTSPIVTELGGNYGYAGIVLFAGYSLLLGDAHDRETTTMLAETLVTSGVWAQVGKLMTGQERPTAAYANGHLGNPTWHGPLAVVLDEPRLSHGNYNSFPSGHTTTAFAIATIFSEQYDGWAVPAISYSLATLVGVSRMIEHAHWASNVFAGACLGYLCARQVVDSHRKEDARVGELPRVRTSFYATMSGGYPTVGVLVRW